MKRNLPYVVLSVVSLIVAIILSNVFGFSLTNTWQASVALLFIFGPLAVLAWRRANDHNKNPLHLLIRGLVIFFGIGYIVLTITVLTSRG